MQGTIVNFRGSKRVKNHYQMVVKVDDIDTKEKASGLVGRHVAWKTPSGKEIKGRISKEHGNKGTVRVIFEKGMPGQCLSNKVEILEN